MRYDKNSRTFYGRASDIPANKKMRVAIVKVDCGGKGVATFKIAVSISPVGKPQISVRSLKPKTGEFKVRTITAVPVPVEE